MQKLKKHVVCKGKTFQIWEPTNFEKFKVNAKRNQIFIEQALNGKNNLITRGII